MTAFINLNVDSLSADEAMARFYQEGLLLPQKDGQRWKMVQKIKINFQTFFLKDGFIMWPL